MVSKTRTSHVQLGREFEERRPNEEYRAVVVGEVSHKVGRIVIELEGKEAITDFEVISTFESSVDGTLTELKLWP